MIRKYRMVLYSQMGPKSGTLRLREENEIITGALCVLSHEIAIFGKREADGRLHLIHRIITAVSEYSCQSILWDAGNTLSGELHVDQSGTPWGCSKYQAETIMPWSGVQIEETEV